MPMLMISPATMQLVRAKRPRGFELSGELLRLGDGRCLLHVTDQIAVDIATERVHGESDDGVVSRLLQGSSERRRTAL